MIAFIVKVSRAMIVNKMICGSFIIDDADDARDSAEA
jgi:hypothetical protein